jgi:hypothetical protein
MHQRLGTRYLPAERSAPERLGIASIPDFPEAYLDHLRLPFQWTKMTEQPSRPDSD